ncbi:MAG: diguanylate cyclase [Planctomycetota bacterium]|nr:diguanylate cyclase [Planctomycetota bacterium]
MRKIKLSSQSVLVGLAISVAGGMFLLNRVFLQPFLARQADRMVARAARAAQGAVDVRVQSEEASLLAACETLAAGQAFTPGPGGEPTISPAHGLSSLSGDGLWLQRADGRVVQALWLGGSGPSLLAIERALSGLGGATRDSGLLRVGEELMFFARREAPASPGRTLFLTRRLTPERLARLVQDAAGQLQLVKPDAVPAGAMSDGSGALAYWPTGAGRLAVAWPVKDAAGRTRTLFRATVDVREIQAQAVAISEAVADLLMASFAIIVLVILGTIILLANPISRLLCRVERIEADPAGAEELTRSLHAEPLAIAKALRKSFGAVMRLSKTDELTDLANRRHFDQALQSAFVEARRYGRPLSVVVIDIDMFKAVNDSAGHCAGDDVIRAVGRAIRQCCRTADLPARQGGDEFVILMPETAAAGAAVVAERIRAAVAAINLATPGGGISVTVSTGVADMDSGGAESYQHLLALADKALYAAKQQGRNRVVQAIAIDEPNLSSCGPEFERVDMLRGWIDGIDSRFKALCVRSINEFVQMTERRDPYMANHARKVAHYAVLIARCMRLGEQAIQRVGLAALLHDIGMVALPDSVVLSTDALTADQLIAVKRHPVIGARILQGVSYLESAALAVKSHHERFDGKGYPDGLVGREIPLDARIIAVADSFDAMTSPRAFRRPRSIAAAMADLRQASGAQYDPEIVAAFMSQAHRLGEKIKDLPALNAVNELAPSQPESPVAG